MRENVVFKDQSASALRFNLIAGTPDFGELTIIEAKQFSLGSTRLTAGILGASHFASVNFGSRSVSEVFACAELKTDLPRVFFGPLGAVLKKIVLSLDSITYSFEAEVVKGGRGLERLGLLEQRLPGFSPEKNGVGLTFEFPGSGQTGSFPAKTVVLARIDERGAVEVSTAHSYPNESKVVFTRSEFIGNTEEVS